jgi:hypothetical protein
MNSIMRQLVAENNFKTEDNLINYARTKINYNLFQILLQRKNIDEDLPPFCDVLTVFYKGVPLITYYPENIKEDIEELKQHDILNMSKEELRKLMFDTFKNEIFFNDDAQHALEVLLDDKHYIIRTLETEEEMFNVIYD